MRISRLVPALVVLGLAACDDGSGPAAPSHTSPARVVDVFPAFEAAFNQRHVGRYARLLDDDFVFYLSETDVLAGGKPPQWSRATEIDYMTRLLDPANTFPMQCDSVYFDFNYPRLIELHRFHPPSAPEETWYSTTLSYDFVFLYHPDVTVATVPGNRAGFVIRNDGTENEPVWKIVEMRDFSPDRDPEPARTAGMPPWTLGAVKAMYGPQE